MVCCQILETVQTNKILEQTLMIYRNQSSDLEQVLYYELYCLEGDLKGHFLRGCVTISSASSIHLN